MIKEKPCKGTGKARGFGCGKMTQHRIYGLGKMCCYAEWLYSTPEGLKKVEKATLKASKPRIEFEQNKKQSKERNKITTLIKSVVNTFHKYVRLRDKGKPCIACGTPWKEDFQASHYFKAELYSSLKFNELNVHSGCKRCNLMNEGNLSEYSVNLPKRIGNDNFDVLNGLADVEKRLKWKWDREGLISIRKYYNKKIKEIT